MSSMGRPIHPLFGPIADNVDTTCLQKQSTVLPVIQREFGVTWPGWLPEYCSTPILRDDTLVLRALQFSFVTGHGWSTCSTASHSQTGHILIIVVAYMCLQFLLLWVPLAICCNKY